MVYGPKCICTHAESHHSYRGRYCMMPKCDCLVFKKKIMMGVFVSQVPKEEEEIIHKVCGKTIESCLCDSKTIQAICDECLKDARFCVCAFEEEENSGP